MTTAFKIGSGAQDSPSDIKFIWASASATNNYMSCEFPAGTDYEVTAGKIFYITKILYYSTSGGGKGQIGYGDTGVANGAAAPTNAVACTLDFYAVVATINYELDVFIPILAGKFPYVQSTGDLFAVIIHGIEI